MVTLDTVTDYGGRSTVAPLGTERSLWRRVNTTGASEEVAEGDEDCQIAYGSDTNGDLSADVFDTADNVADWNQVIAVRAALLVSSKEANATRAAQSYDFNGVTSNLPTDRRLRKTYYVTILLRNRTI